jgi:hypothetical protein
VLFLFVKENKGIERCRDTAAQGKTSTLLFGDWSTMEIMRKSENYF